MTIIGAGFGISRVTLTPFERESGIYLVHSDLWQQPDGTITWTADHPCGWQTGGDAPDVDSAMTAVEQAFIAALPEEDRPQQVESTRVVAAHFDG